MIPRRLWPVGLSSIGEYIYCNSAHHFLLHNLELAFEQFMRQTAPFTSLAFEGHSRHPRWSILQNRNIIYKVDPKEAGLGQGSHGGLGKSDIRVTFISHN